jgi:hypothetical protein
MTCVPTGDTYVGQAANLRSRRDRHIYNFKTRHRQNPFLHRLMELGCGPDDFTFRILTSCTIANLDKWEAHWIRKLKPTLNYNSPRGCRAITAHQVAWPSFTLKPPQR